MQFSPSTAERLDTYLGAMPFESLNMLIREIELARLRGESDTVGALIIERSRHLARKRKQRFSRVPTPMRMFMVPMEPFFVNRPIDQKQPGRIARTSLMPIWTWLKRDLLPTLLPDLETRVTNAILANEMNVAAAHINQLQDAAVQAVTAVLRDADGSGRVYGRWAAHVGGGQILEDARDMVTVLRHGAGLNKFARTLPGMIADLGEEEFDWLRGSINELAADNDKLVAFALAIVIGRLRHPAQILRLAAYAANSDEADKVAAHAYGQAGRIILHDIASSAAEVQSALADPLGYQQSQLALSRYYKLAHDMRTILEIAASSHWSKRLVHIRANLSAVLEARIRAVPRLIRSNLAPRSGAERFAMPDITEIDEAEMAINLMQDVRVYMSELALNDLVSRLSQEVNHFLSHAADVLLMRLRAVEPREQDAARAQLAALVRLTRVAQGDEIADLLEHGGFRAMQAMPSIERAKTG